MAGKKISFDADHENIARILNLPDAILGKEPVTLDQLIAYIVSPPVIEVFTVGGTIADTTTILYFDPAAQVNSATITLPATPVSNQTIEIHFGGQIASGNTVVVNLTFAANVGQTLLGLGSGMTALSGDGYIVRYRLANTTWYPY